MNSALVKYLDRIDHRHPEYDFTESIRVKHADALHRINRYISNGQYILNEPARFGNVAVDENEDEDENEGEEIGHDEFDPNDLDEEELMRGLAGPGAVVIDGKTELVHNWLGTTSTNVEFLLWKSKRKMQVADVRKQRQRWITTWRVVCRTSSLTELAEVCFLLQYHHALCGKYVFFSDLSLTVFIIPVEVHLVPYS